MSQPGLWRAPPRSVRREILLMGGIFAVVPLVLTGAFVPMDAGWGPVRDFYLPALVVTVCVGGAIRGIYAGIVPRLPLAGFGWLGRPVVHALVVLVGAGLGSELAKWVLALGYGASPATFHAVTRIALVVSAVLVGGIASWDALLGYVREVELREEQARRAAVQAELSALRARVQPHFLFNSLNAVAALLHEDVGRAEETLERISSLLRYALRGSDAPTATLRDELEAARDYLEIERIRLEERLRYSIDASEELGGEPVPRFVLQPLVENAVLHGIAPRPEGGEVRVAARLVPGALVLEVVDDGDGPGASKRSGTGTALADLRSRLALGHGDRATVELQASNPGCRAVIRLPRPT